MGQLDDIMKRLDAYIVNKDERKIPSATDIAELEAVLGHPLPDDYKTFIKKYGGTALRAGAMFIIDDDPPFGSQGDVDVFYGFSENDFEDIRTILSETYAGRIPDGTLPIASDPLGNQILLGISDEYRDEVMFWDHEFQEIAEDFDVETMIDDLEAQGIDTDTMDDHEIILQWCEDNADQLEKPPQLVNVYHIDDTFMDFMMSLQADEVA